MEALLKIFFAKHNNKKKWSYSAGKPLIRFYYGFGSLKLNSKGFSGPQFGFGFKILGTIGFGFKLGLVSVQGHKNSAN